MDIVVNILRAQVWRFLFPFLPNNLYVFNIESLKFAYKSWNSLNFSSRLTLFISGNGWAGWAGWVLSFLVGGGAVSVEEEEVEAEDEEEEEEEEEWTVAGNSRRAEEEAEDNVDAVECEDKKDNEVVEEEVVVRLASNTHSGHDHCPWGTTYSMGTRQNWWYDNEQRSQNSKRPSWLQVWQ